MKTGYRPCPRPVAGWIFGALIAVLFFSGEKTFGQYDAPKVQAAVRKGVAFLRKEIEEVQNGRVSLAAYAMVKGGEPIDSPPVQKAIEEVQERTQDGSYNPSPPDEHIYTAGVDLMLLSSVDPKTYRREMEIIVKYVISHQDSDGFWDYLPPKKTKGDTSISQYGMLGLWAASRAGIHIPQEVWDRAALWFMKTQLKDGSFIYHPEDPNSQWGPSHSMTAAGAGSLGIARLHLFPNGKTSNPNKNQNKTDRPKFGVLEKFTGGSDQPSPKKPKQYELKSNIRQINAAVGKGMAWLTRSYAINTRQRFNLYYLYSLERMCALEDIERLGGHDWYAEGCKFLLSIQQADGSWTRTNIEDTSATSFALLFLAKSTAQDLGKVKPSSPIGNGLLAGGRGLPDDLSNPKKEEDEESKTPLEQLLTELEESQNVEMEQTQKAIVQKVQLGDPEKLIGQRDRLLKLVKSPQPEVRRTALWALARAGKLRDTPLFIEALDDNNLDVIVEAHNGLCWITRRIDGLGLPDNPVAGLPEDASDEQRAEAIRKWKEKAVKRWKAWYLKNRPYDERDDLTKLPGS